MDAPLVATRAQAHARGRTLPLRRLFSAAAACAAAAALLGAFSLRQEPLPNEAGNSTGGADPAHALHAQTLTLTPDGAFVAVPLGTATEYAGNGHRFELPPVIELRAGQRIEVRNDDLVTHVILGMAVPAGEIRSRIVDGPGYEVYSAGCAAHSTGTAMTTLVISGPPAQAGA